jgi:AbrB family looped-hinge helix DNA binding protein
MDTVTLSPQFQVEIPLKAREELGLKPGDRLAVTSVRGALQMVRIPPIKEMRGFLRGRLVDTEIEEDEDRF